MDRITITTGWPSNQARYQLDWTREGWDLTAFDDRGNERFTRMFRTPQGHFGVHLPDRYGA
jgi:hypothetical protein